VYKSTYVNPVNRVATRASDLVDYINLHNTVQWYALQVKRGIYQGM